MIFFLRGLHERAFVKFRKFPVPFRLTGVSKLTPLFPGEKRKKNITEFSVV